MAFAPFRVVVPCSTSNLGPGFDCLGLALSREVALEVRPGESGPLWKDRLGTLAGVPTGPEERFEAGLRAAAEAAGKPLPRLSLRGDSNVPIARGLGSSGAATVAGLVAGFRVLGEEAASGWLFDLGYAIEGHPDNVGPALVGGCVVAMPDAHGHVHWFESPVHPDLRVAVAWPAVRLETRVARGVLPETVPFRVARDQARRLPQLLRALADLDPARLDLGIGDELHTPYRARLIPGCERVMAAGRGAGALGVAISGSGSAIVALGTGSMHLVAEAMAHAFERAGEAAEAHVLEVPRRGYRIEPLEA